MEFQVSEVLTLFFLAVITIATTIFVAAAIVSWFWKMVMKRPIDVRWSGPFVKGKDHHHHRHRRGDSHGSSRELGEPVDYSDCQSPEFSGRSATPIFGSTNYDSGGASELYMPAPGYYSPRSHRRHETPRNPVGLQGVLVFLVSATVGAILAFVLLSAA
jgi:hypothetical protein